MIPLKLQIELRFTHILDFSTAYKTILSPYLKLANFGIQNFGEPEENCTLTFKDEPNIRIDARWDRLIYVVNSKDENFLNPKSNILFFLEIFDKLRQLSSFGNLNDFLIAGWHLIESETADSSSLKDQWLKTPPSIPFPIDDIGIVIESKNSNKDVFKLQYGQFKSSDIKNFGLAPSDQSSTDLESKKGILVHTIYVKKGSTVTLNALKEVYTTTVTTIEKNFEQ